MPSSVLLTGGVHETKTDLLRVSCMVMLWTPSTNGILILAAVSYICVASEVQQRNTSIFFCLQMRTQQSQVHTNRYIEIVTGHTHYSEVTPCVYSN